MPTTRITLSIIMATGMLVPFFLHAAPELILTWQAVSYTPQGFMGKALPTADTPVEASILLIDGGRIINLAPYEINWYADEKRIAGGTGVYTAKTKAPATGQDSFELRAHVAKYADSPIDAFATIPIIKPQITIIKKMKRGAATEFSIAPYFWNITDPRDITITWDDTEDSVTAHATSKNNPFEFAKDSVLKR